MRVVVCFFLAIILNTAPALAQWYEVRTDNFTVSGNASKNKLESFAVELETYRILLAGIVGRQLRPEPRPVEIYLMTTQNRFEDIVGPATGLVGIYTPLLNNGIFVANIDRSGERFGFYASEVVKHEYVHHFAYVNGPFYYPIWYSEGLADFFSTMEINGTSVEVGKIIQGRINEMGYQDWISWRSVIASKAYWRVPGDRALSAQSVSLYYAQSWFLVHYLQSDPNRAAQINEYLRRVRDGAPSVKTFEEVFDLTIEELTVVMEEKWDEGLPLKYYDVSTVDFSSLSEPYTRRLSNDETRSRRALIASQFGLSDDKIRQDRIDDLDRARRDDPENLEILKRLVEIHTENGEFDLAAPYVQLARSIDPEAGLALYMEGKFLHGALRDAENFDATIEIWNRIKTKYDGARKADPLSASAHYNYAETFLRAPGGVSEAAIDAALTAMELSPDAYDVPLTAATLLSRGGYREDAIYLLKGLAAWAPNARVRNRANDELRKLNAQAVSDSSEADQSGSDTENSSD